MLWRGSAGDNLTNNKDTIWSRLRRHFTESFSGELLAQNRSNDELESPETFTKRRRHAYRYVLVALAVVLLPVVAHNIFIRQLLPAAAALTMLGILMVNILLLSANREAFLSPALVLTLALILILLSLYYGQNYSLYLMFPLLVALPVLLRSRWAIFLGVLSGLLVAPLVLTQYDSTTAAAIGISMGLTWLVSAWLVFALTEQSRRLKGMAVTDPLTGAYNRRYFELQAVRAVQHWTRYKRSSALLLIDVDHFKRINDRYGHAQGDKALKALVRVIEQRVRRSDIVCRFGGEEFVVLLSETNCAHAVNIANDLRRTVAETRLLPEGGFTISIGVSDVTQVRDMEHWLKLTDAALYLAKNSGRNRVEAAQPEQDSAPVVAQSIPLWR